MLKKQQKQETSLKYKPSESAWNGSCIIKSLSTNIKLHW